ncbi:CDP-diacylglycerol--inositol 3-phosphatidyltransferase isoform X1 [Lepisosteus oculatus]|uniref:CDP-diacylglycerol--inositol 3-phosphatidyltransferase isoform X1 n=1 Tax=Lepisosteus oculatus TaxID=7918 RepID=UPI00372180E9
MAEENIFLFVPNLIGYARIALALLALYFMPTSPVPAIISYLISALLDAFDGMAARSLNQGTKFGAMLDMLTDRCVTMCLLVNLSLLYPQCTFLFQLSMTLDVASHWLHLHSSIMKGSSSHKTIDLSGNPLLRVYYTSRCSCRLCCTSALQWRCSSLGSASSISSRPRGTWRPSTARRGGRGATERGRRAGEGGRGQALSASCISRYTVIVIGGWGRQYESLSLFLCQYSAFRLAASQSALQRGGGPCTPQPPTPPPQGVFNDQYSGHQLPHPCPYCVLPPAGLPGRF